MPFPVFEKMNDPLRQVTTSSPLLKHNRIQLRYQQFKGKFYMLKYGVRILNTD
jgi:hypothetical protein